MFKQHLSLQGSPILLRIKLSKYCSQRQGPEALPGLMGHDQHAQGPPSPLGPRTPFQPSPGPSAPHHRHAWQRRMVLPPPAPRVPPRCPAPWLGYGTGWGARPGLLSPMGRCLSMYGPHDTLTYRCLESSMSVQNEWARSCYRRSWPDQKSFLHLLNEAE